MDVTLVANCSSPRISFHLQKLGAWLYSAVGSLQMLSFNLSRQTLVPEPIWALPCLLNPPQALLYIYSVKVW